MVLIPPFIHLFFQTSLREVHKKLHLLLAGEKGQPSSAITTCTLISSSDNVDSKHLLLSVEGFVPPLQINKDSLPITRSKSRRHTQKIQSYPIVLCPSDKLLAPHLVIRNAVTVVRASLEKILEQKIVENSLSLASESLYEDGHLSIAFELREKGFQTFRGWFTGRHRSPR